LSNCATPSVAEPGWSGQIHLRGRVNRTTLAASASSIEHSTHCSGAG
jgi:hypothetical protein